MHTFNYSIYTKDIKIIKQFKKSFGNSFYFKQKGYFLAKTPLTKLQVFLHESKIQYELQEKAKDYYWVIC